MKTTLTLTMAEAENLLSRALFPSQEGTIEFTWRVSRRDDRDPSCEPKVYEVDVTHVMQTERGR